MKGQMMKEDFCKSALREAPVGYACNKIIFDKNGIPCDYEFLDVNSAFADLIGLAEKELIGKRFSEIFPELCEMKPEWIRTVGDIAVNGGENEFEEYSEIFDTWLKIKIFSPEKSYFIIYILDTSTENEQQSEMKNLTGVFEESEFKYKGMSEEKDAWERRLHEIADVLKLENDLQFQRIIENLPFSLNIATLDGVVLYANTKCLELFEMGEDVIGTKAITKKWVDPGKREQWIKALKRKGVVNDFEMHLKTSKGKEFWSIGSGITIQYQDRACILSTQLDITERKRMESALKLSEEKYRSAYRIHLGCDLGAEPQEAEIYIHQPVHLLSDRLHAGRNDAYVLHGFSHAGIGNHHERSHRAGPSGVFAGSGQPEILYHGDQTEVQKRKCDLDRGLFEVPL